MTQAALKEVATIERNAIQEFEVTPEMVAKMAKEYLVITVPEADTKAYKMAREALTTCVRTRTEVDKHRKDLGEDARKWVAEVNQAAKELIAPLAPVEDHLSAELKREDDRKEAIKAEAARIEAERISKIRTKISDIAAMVTSMNGLTSDTLRQLVADIEVIPLPLEEYQELIGEANQTKHAAFVAASEALEARVKWEQEESDRKVLVEKLKRQKAEQEAEAKRLEEVRLENERAARQAEEKARKEREALETEKAAFEKAKRNEQERIEREAQAKAEAEAAAKKAEEEAKAKAEREKAEAEEQARLETERAARAEALRPDREKLVEWAYELLEMDRPVLVDPVAEKLADEALEKIHDAANFLIDAADILIQI